MWKQMEQDLTIFYVDKQPGLISCIKIFTAKTYQVAQLSTRALTMRLSR